MKKTILSIALLSIPLISSANPNVNWGNGNNGFNNGSSWNMPSMNWGNNNGGFNKGSNWNMPNFNNGNGNSWNMPSMNWGTNRSFGNGNNWNMPSMNWNNSKGNNFDMPNFNWNNNNSGPGWNSKNWGNNIPNYTYMPRAPQQNRRNGIPLAPKPPQFIPRLNTPPKNTAKPVAKPNIATNAVQNATNTIAKKPVVSHTAPVKHSNQIINQGVAPQANRVPLPAPDGKVKFPEDMLKTQPIQ